MAGYAALADRVEFRFGLFLDARLCCAYELIVRRAPCGVNFPFKMRHLRLIGSIVQLVGFGGLPLVVVYDVQNGHRAKFRLFCHFCDLEHCLVMANVQQMATNA